MCLVQLLNNLIRAASQQTQELSSASDTSEEEEEEHNSLPVSAHVADERKHVRAMAPVVKRGEAGRGQNRESATRLDSKHVSPRVAEDIKKLHTELCQMQVSSRAWLADAVYRHLTLLVSSNC